MATNEYFDTRTLTVPSAGGCPVRGCHATLQSSGDGKTFPLRCPDHEIKIHTKTFGYGDPLRNILFERNYFNQNIRNNPNKSETHRLGYENSEDALTWNVFSQLARTDRLTELASHLAQVELKSRPTLYLWGLPIDLDDPQRPATFATLAKARNKFERGIHKMLTEPDVMLYVHGQCLILIEAKFTSGNTIAKTDAQDVPNEKPKSRAGILSRYSVDHVLPTRLNTDHLVEPFFSQLYRNLVFAIWMARELHVEWRLVNLVSALHHRDSPDPTPFIHSLLPLAFQNRFVRYDWESLFGDYISGSPELGELAEYLRYKSANCAQGLAI